MSMKEISTDSLDITVEEFDQMNTQHEFSKEYKRNKKRIMKEYRNEGRVVRTGTWKTAVAAAGITIVGTPLVVNAAMDGELFSRLWGTSGRENVESTELTVKDEEIGREYTYTYPKREYVEPEPEKASELVGDNISPEVQKLTLPDGTLLTIKNAVCDQNAVVMEYTLEKTGGVVQGMSGSPIVQNDKIVGVVTHVIIDHVNTGYGIFITNMLEEGDRKSR